MNAATTITSETGTVSREAMITTVMDFMNDTKCSPWHHREWLESLTTEQLTHFYQEINNAPGGTPELSI